MPPAHRHWEGACCLLSENDLDWPQLTLCMEPLHNLLLCGDVKWYFWWVSDPRSTKITNPAWVLHISRYRHFYWHIYWPNCWKKITFWSFCLFDRCKTISFIFLISTFFNHSFTCSCLATISFQLRVDSNPNNCLILYKYKCKNCFG